MWLCMGNADTIYMGYAQIMSAEELDFSFAGHISLSSRSKSH